MMNVLFLRPQPAIRSLKYARALYLIETLSFVIFNKLKKPKKQWRL